MGTGPLLILGAFFCRIWIEGEQHEIAVSVEVPGPIALLRAAAGEWAGTKRESAGDLSDALSDSSNNLYLTVACSSKANVVGPVGLEPTTRGLKVRCSTD